MTRGERWTRSAAVAALWLLVAALAIRVGDSAQADHGSFNYTWFSTVASNTSVDDHTTCCNYWPAIQGAVSDWNTTDLNVTTASHADAEIHAENTYYGNTGWVATFGAYRASTLCGDLNGPTGSCNTTTLRANRAYIYFNNTYLAGSGLDGLRRLAAVHEAGHIFGLSHTSCTAFAVMRLGICNPYTSIQGGDAAHANAAY